MDAESESIALFKEDGLIAYGNDTALRRLQAGLRHWLDAGMPGGSCFDVAVYRTDVDVKARENQWLTKQRDSQFLWTLN